MPRVDVAGLAHLINCPNKNAANTIILEIYKQRYSSPSEEHLNEIAGLLKINTTQTLGMFKSGRDLIRHTLYNNLDEAGIAAAFPSSFDDNLKGLIAKIIAAHSGDWAAEQTSSTIGLPHLVDVNWNIDVKTASNFIDKMAAPTCMVELKVEDGAQEDGVRRIQFELNREKLNTMVDGLSKIRDQLNAIQ